MDGGAALATLDPASGKAARLWQGAEVVTLGPPEHQPSAAVARAIRYTADVVGVEHVGLGSDFDGAVRPIGMQDVTHIPQITDALLKKGYPESDIRKILGENTLRVLSEVQHVSRELNSH